MSDKSITETQSEGNRAALAAMSADDWAEWNAWHRDGRAATRLLVYADPEFKRLPSVRKVLREIVNRLGHMRHWSSDEVRAVIEDPRWWANDFLAGQLEPKEHKEHQELMLRWWAWFRESVPASSTAQEFELNLALTGQCYFVRNVGNKPAVVSWDSDGRLVVRSLQAFRDSRIKDVKLTWPTPAGFAHTTLADQWLESPSIRAYEGIGFYPGINGPKDGNLNLWRGYNAVRVEVVNDRAVFPPLARRWLEHVRKYICGDDDLVFEYVLGWIAEALNHPMRKAETAIVMTGPQGSGKGVFAETVLRFFKPHSQLLGKSSGLTSNFNAHLEDCQMVYADEAFFVGNRADGDYLKHLVTTPELRIERKNFDSYMARKWFRVIMATNHDHAVNAEFDDRRYLVLRADAGKLNKDLVYFGAILDDLKAGGYDELFSWLTSDCWKTHDLGPRPETAELQRQKDLSLPGHARAVFQMLQTGDPLCSVLIDDGTGGVFLPTMEFIKAWRLDTREATALGTLLSRLFGKGRRASIDGKQVSGFWLPALPEAREKWDDTHNREGEWPEAVSEWDPGETDLEAFETVAWGLVRAASKLPPEDREKFQEALSLLHKRLRE